MTFLGHLRFGLSFQPPRHHCLLVRVELPPSTFTSLSAIIPPLSTLCSLLEQSFLHPWWHYLCQQVWPFPLALHLHVYWPTSSQFRGHLKIKKVWTYCPFSHHPKSHFPPLALFQYLAAPKPKPGNCPKFFFHLTGFWNYRLPCYNMNILALFLSHPFIFTNKILNWATSFQMDMGEISCL